jgi:hypothetical protein
MKAEVYNREIHYDFSTTEVDFLKSLGLWEDIRNKLESHEVITIEGYERITARESS